MTGVVVPDVAKGGYLKDDSADDEEVALYDLMIDMEGEGRDGEGTDKAVPDINREERGGS
jgi:hypothetical protein